MNRILIPGIALGLLALGCGEGGGDAAVEGPAPTATAGGHATSPACGSS